MVSWSYSQIGSDKEMRVSVFFRRRPAQKIQDFLEAFLKKMPISPVAYAVLKTALQKGLKVKKTKKPLQILP